MNCNCNENLNNNHMNNMDNKSNCNDFCVTYEQDTNFNQLTRAYVLFQKFCGVLDLEDALVKGTAFEELHSPYCAKKHKKTKNCY